VKFFRTNFFPLVSTRDCFFNFPYFGPLAQTVLERSHINYRQLPISGARSPSIVREMTTTAASLRQSCQKMTQAISQRNEIMTMRQCSTSIINFLCSASLSHIVDKLSVSFMLLVRSLARSRVWPTEIERHFIVIYSPAYSHFCMVVCLSLVSWHLRR
jgi:hypothetical protein